MLKSGMTAAVLLLLVSACDRGPAEPSAADPPSNTAAGMNAGDDAAANMAAADNGVGAAPTLAPLSSDAASAMIKQREDNFEKMGGAAKASFKALEASSPDMAVIAKSAATIAAFAPQLPSWFPPGTGPEAGKTLARPEIWQQPKEFAGRHADLLKTAAAFDLAAKSGDVAAVRTAYADLGKSCKACHDKFRTEKKK